jgi:hypothetical protein
MGGGASFLAARENPAITAIANLAAAETNPSAIDAASSITIPALVFSGSNDCVTPPPQHQIPMYEALASDCKTWISITGASHCQFADNNFYCNLGEGGCPDPTISRATQHAITLGVLLPFLDATLKDDFAAWTRFQDLIAEGSGITSRQDCLLAGVGAPIARAIGTIQASPNPFRETLLVRFDGPAGTPIEVYDSAGRFVRALDATRNGAVWNGRDASGRSVPAGMYFLRERSGTASSRTVLRIR